jgi:hypothetical protein
MKIDRDSIKYTLHKTPEMKLQYLMAAVWGGKSKDIPESVLFDECALTY